MPTSYERLIEASKRLIWMDGYSAVSPRTIQQEAGVGQGAMYHHFASKAELAQAAIARSAADLLDEVSVTLADDGRSIPDRLSAFVSATPLNAYGCRIGKLTSDSKAMDDNVIHATVTDTFASITALLESAITDGIRDGEIARHIDAAQLASAIVSLRQGAHVQALAVGSQKPYSDAEKTLARMLAG